MTYNDPQEVHSTECQRCGAFIRDNETSVYEHGVLDVCRDCFEELCEAEAEEEA